MSIALHLPDQDELQAVVASNAEASEEAREEEAAAADAAAAVEEGDEIEGEQESEWEANEEAREEGGEEEASEEADEKLYVIETPLGDEWVQQTKPLALPDAVGMLDCFASNARHVVADPSRHVMDFIARTEQLPPSPPAPTEPALPAPPAPSPTPTPLATIERPTLAEQRLPLPEWLEYERRLQDATDAYVGASLECDKLEGAYKRAKQRVKDSLEALVEIKAEEPDGIEDVDVGLYRALTPTISFEVPVIKSAEAEARGEGLSIASPTQAATPAPGAADPAVPDPNAWRRVPISVLGLKSTLEEKLTDEGYGTIGKLEDLRAGFGGLKSLKGIGQAKADAIEDAILNWLSKNRDAEVLAGARGEEGEATVEAATEPADDTPEAIEEAEDVSAEDTAPTEAEATAAAADEASEYVENVSGDLRRFADIKARAHAIFFSEGDFENVSPDDALNPIIDNAHCWESGEQGYHKGYDLIDCPWLAGSVERDDWLRGWMSAKLTNEEGWEGPGSEK